MNVMIIDDDPECLKSLDYALQLNGFKVYAFLSPAKAMAELNSLDVDVVITDYHFPHIQIKGTAIIEQNRNSGSNTPVIIITGDQDKQIETLSRRAGAYAFFKKPMNIKKIITTIEAIPNGK